MTDLCASDISTSDALSRPAMFQLNQWLARSYGTAQDWDVRLVMSLGQAARRRRIFRARDRFGHDIAIKSHALRLRNGREYRALRELRGTNARTVEAHYLSWDHSFYTMDWIGAPTLGSVLHGPDREAWLTKAGAWLGRLHRSPARHRWLQAPLTRMHLPRTLRQGAIGQASTVMRARLGSVSMRDGPKAVLHGDIHTGNLFAADGSLVAFDREMESYGLTFLDTGRFLADLTRCRAKAAVDGSPWTGTDDQDRRAFFEGYGPVDASHVRLFDAMEDAFLFRTWRRQAKRSDHMLTPAMGARGLLPAGDTPHPGRLVRTPNGSVVWDTSVATAHVATA